MDPHMGHQKPYQRASAEELAHRWQFAPAEHPYHHAASRERIASRDAALARRACRRREHGEALLLIAVRRARLAMSGQHAHLGFAVPLARLGALDEPRYTAGEIDDARILHHD